jgi:Lrp/AsnC family leucine-responsive transcriptional regulator
MNSTNKKSHACVGENMQIEKLDAIDLQLLEILQSEGRTKRNELAEKVKLSIPAVSERMRKLEERGIVRGFTAVLDARKIGLEVTAFIFVMAESSTFYPEIIKHAAAHQEILECHAITGEGSHILKARTQSTATLEKLLSQIQAWPGVKNTRTSVVLSSPKETTVLPLAHLKAT